MKPAMIARVTRTQNDTRRLLLEAAEQILVEQGITGISVRRVGERASVNPTLVTYHFGSIGKLLDELCSLNLEPIMRAWAAIQPGGGEDVETILRRWLAPMLNPAAFTPGGRALVVLDEIAAHGEGALRQRVLEAMSGFSQRLRTVLAPHLPDLDETELRARLRLISGAVLGPPPRAHGAPAGANGRALDDIEYLVRFARAGLAC